MNKEDKKLIFGYMGWCLHRYAKSGKLWGTGVCTKCKDPLPTEHYLDGKDMVAAISRMVGVDGFCTDWIEFDLFVKESGVKAKSADWLLSHIPWLMQPARFFELMANWLEVRNAKI